MTAPCTLPPWRVSHSEDDAMVFNGEKPVAVINAQGWAVACNTSYYPTGLDAANANLIAAAPDLYEALEALERQTVELYRSIAPHANYSANADGGDNNENTFADRDVAVIAARAALCKARGQS